jgi:raffinose/stachyose/melibiose transport system permease protein
LKRSPLTATLVSLIVLCAAALFMAPFYVQLVYAFKSRPDVAQTGLAFPTQLFLGNFADVFGNTKILLAFVRTTVVTVLSVALLQVCASMAAWVVVRNGDRWFYRALYYLFLAAIMVPFQVLMLPLYSLFRSLGLLNTLPGLILGISGFQLAYNVFIISSFVRTVPLALEESARMDGASVFTTFWKIVFPLLSPILVTSLILNTVSSWNDMQISLVVAFREDVRTLQYALFMYFGQYSVQIHQAFAAFLITLLPVIILYFVLQRALIKGLTAGSVKG